ncbi:hypothetical protein GJAV_G00158500 [Gymnothorax javanicus]|nr:hypothetical protein GJAV_G00158500 [Gymnothorax javanicus]
MILTLIFVIFLIGHGQTDESQPLDENVSVFAVVNSTVYVATNNKLYQMRRNLTVEVRRDTAQDNRVKLLVPFEKNNTLITCGTTMCGYCDVLDLKNISKTLYTEPSPISSVFPNESSIGFLVDLGGSTAKPNTYLLIGAIPILPKNCTVDAYFITLRNTDHLQDGDIFSPIETGSTEIRNRPNKPLMDLDVEFVDGFARDEHVYILLNLNATGPQPRVRLLSMRQKGSKRETLSSFRGTTLRCCGSEKYARLTSSVVIEGSRLLWAGIFNVSGDPFDTESTVLAIFNITHTDARSDEDPDFCSESCSSISTKTSVTIEPKAIYKHRSMTSVATVTVDSWLVLFIGTADGQLIQISMDKAMKTTCPIVLHETDDDRPVHPRMILDPISKMHLYLALGNQMKRVPVAQCGRYLTVEDCWFSQSPFCGWCASQRRCMFRDQCLRSTWITIPDGSVQKQIISFQIREMPSQESIILNVAAHLRVISSQQSPTISCTFTAERGESLCAGLMDTDVLPDCSCAISRDKFFQFPSGLGVTVTISVDGQNISESWKPKNCPFIQGEPKFALCSECIAAGCQWSFTEHTCSWMPWNSYETQTLDKCRNYSSGLNIPVPEIYSIIPNEISIYGKNYANIKGKNLNHVTKIRLRGNMDCHLREIPFQNRSNNRITLHIPAGNRGWKTICLELPDGRCYGEAEIAFRSLPSCSGSLSPNTSWAR